MRLTLCRLAWTTNGNIHWAVSALGIVLYAGSVFIVLQCVLVYLSLAYPKYEASLFAGNDISRSAVAFAFILFSRFMFIDLGIDKGVTLLAGLSVLGVVSLLLFNLCHNSEMMVVSYTDLHPDWHVYSLLLRCRSPC
jgi:DHA1 family multidrug resistance protein-like MFS transporter